MSVGYRAVQWNRNKRAYDAAIAAGVLLYIGVFVVVGKLVWRGDHAVSDPILVARALGALGLLLLHVILCIGPLARLDRRFLPLLYNRRHLGVTMFLVVLGHAVIGLGFYHGFGIVSPPASLLTSNTQVGSISGFPFEWFGAAALVILFLMAATSHDFWLKNLGPGVWKALHMLVYVAWALLLLHVTLGALQAELSVVYPIVLLAGAGGVVALHLMAGRRETTKDARPAAGAADGWIDAGPVDAISDGQAKVLCSAGRERIAVFRHGGKVSAIASVLAHQGGPLGEGRIVDGCVTCPWHGYQYRPADGQSPPPFTEKVPTYRVRIDPDSRRVLVDPKPLPPGTPVDPACI